MAQARSVRPLPRLRAPTAAVRLRPALFGAAAGTARPAACLPALAAGARPPEVVAALAGAYLLPAAFNRPKASPRSLAWAAGMLLFSTVFLLPAGGAPAALA